VEELIGLVAQKAGISEKQAGSAVETVVGFLKEKLPGSLGGHIESFLRQGGLLSQADDLLQGVGSILGGLGLAELAPAKKPAAKKPAARKPAAKKPAAHKPTTTRKPAAKKSVAKKPARKP
jgi:hypothetical protein